MISQATSSDYNELLQLWEASVRSIHHFLTEENINIFKPLIHGQYLSTLELFIIRNEAGKIAAFIGLSDEAIEMLFTDPNEQRKGYGKLLLEFAFNEKQITKANVNEQNEQALHFYLKRGFDVIGRNASSSSDYPFSILQLAMIPSLAVLLSRRFHIEDIHSILYIIKYHNQRKEELYHLIYDKDQFTSYQALWTCTHLPSSEKQWLQSKQEELINEVLICPHTGKRRILLQLLEKQSFTNIRVDFLDFCLKRMLSKQEPPGVQSLCIKLAYKLCQPSPELMQEFRMILEISKGEQLSPAVKSVIKNLMKNKKRKKDL